MNSIGKKIYIPGLNGVRAIASIIVLFTHIDEFSYRFKIKNSGFFEKGMGGYGVTMFFTLSGFLITYLLLAEKQSKINIRKFYTRRILRIWPIYYLMIFISVLLLPFIPEIKTSDNLVASLAMYLFFIPNLAYVLNFTISTITPLWSVGVEEQFYLIWPWLVRRSGNILRTSLLVIGVYLLIKIAARFSGNNILYSFVWETRIDCMAIGSIGAYWAYYTKTNFLNIVFNKIVQISGWAILLYSVTFKSIHISTLFDHEIYSLVFLVIILNAGFNKSVLINLENVVLNFIGKISYGIYVYHMLVIFLFSAIYNKFDLSSKMNTYSVYFTIISLTFLIATCSYRYFESYFLNMKSKYAIIKSTNMPDKPNTIKAGVVKSDAVSQLNSN